MPTLLSPPVKDSDAGVIRINPATHHPTSKTAGWGNLKTPVAGTETHRVPLEAVSLGKESKATTWEPENGARARGQISARPRRCQPSDSHQPEKKIVREQPTKAVRQIFWRRSVSKVSRRRHGAPLRLINCPTAATANVCVYLPLTT